ncbi:hypothetical protein SETIT_8G032500v2 [Setaria italica]|uniref:IQ domain-containing protein IQM3 n=1 Tax=Setaria italica TaxID=4555 RepID=A0A368S5E5_SETIT|nr:hypothetical protein SETIT_8G032500v2 [Setaria italica]
MDDAAATKLQKAYRGYRTRRKLADSAFMENARSQRKTKLILLDACPNKWQALNFARLNHSTISFVEPKPKSGASHWNRVSLKASKVGQGLSRDSKALKLASQHWLEAIDPQHRSGHNLHFYYDFWCQSQASQPFFYWLDVGNGKDIDLPECPRTMLKKQCIKYLGPRERELYEYIISEGKVIHKQSGEPLDTSQGPEEAKWIFVMSTARKLYSGKKEKGVFQHSSFLAGGAIIAAGKLTAENGVIKSIVTYSGHYKPSMENLVNFMKFLEESGVDLKEIKARPFTKDDCCDDPTPNDTQNIVVSTNTPQVVLSPNTMEGDEGKDAPEEQAKLTYQRTLSGGLRSPKAAIDVPQKAILERIKSKSESKSYQLGHKLSMKWSTGAGPRIACVNDYPAEIRMQAMEMVDLSPGASTTPA